MSGDDGIHASVQQGGMLACGDRGNVDIRPPDLERDRHRPQCVTQHHRLGERQ